MTFEQSDKRAKTNRLSFLIHAICNHSTFVSALSGRLAVRNFPQYLLLLRKLLPCSQNSFVFHVRGERELLAPHPHPIPSTYHHPRPSALNLDSHPPFPRLSSQLRALLPEHPPPCNGTNEPLIPFMVQAAFVIHPLVIYLQSCSFPFAACLGLVSVCLVGL